MLGLSDMDFGCVPPMVICESWVCLFDMVLGCVPPMFMCKCWAGLFTWLIPWSDISVEYDEDLHEG